MSRIHLAYPACRRPSHQWAISTAPMGAVNSGQPAGAARRRDPRGMREPADRWHSLLSTRPVSPTGQPLASRLSVRRVAFRCRSRQMRSCGRATRQWRNQPTRPLGAGRQRVVLRRHRSPRSEEASGCSRRPRGLRADRYWDRPVPSRSSSARATAVDFPIPDGPSTTTPRPGVRSEILSCGNWCGSTNVYVGIPETLKTSST